MILSYVMWPSTRQGDSASHDGAAHVAFDVDYRLGPCDVKGFVAQSHTPHDCCVRFAPAVADRRATLASRRALPLTCAGLPPAGSRQLACGAQSIFPRACGAISIASSRLPPQDQTSLMALPSLCLASALSTGGLRGSSRRNSRPQARARGPILPAKSAHSISSAFATAFPARSQILPRTATLGRAGSKAARRVAFKRVLAACRTEVFVGDAGADYLTHRDGGMALLEFELRPRMRF